MSLKVWLPLNKDNTNKGAMNITPTNNGTISFISGGKIGKCLSAGTGSQTNNGISYNTNLINDLGTQFSCAIWVKPLGNHVHYNGTFISSGNWNNKCWSFGVSQDNSSVDVFSKGYNQNISCSVPVNIWTHLCCVSDNGIVKLYKNGEYVGSKTVSSATLDSDASNFTVGKETYSSGYFSFNGNINDVRIYDHCLSELEIKELAKGLAVHYKLDDISSGKLIDSTGYGAAGTKSGTITQNSTSPRGTNSLTFAAGSYISAPITASGFTNTYTFSWWGKYTNYSGHMMWGFQNGNRLNLYMSSGNFYWNIGDGTQNPFNVSAATYGDGNWHHFVVTGDGTSSLLYIDGIYRGTAKTFRPITGTTLIFNGWDTSSSYKFNGSLSDFRLYSTCLTADDIKSLYEIGAKIDKQNTIHAYEINEDDSEGIKSNIKKNGIVKSKTFSNYLVNGFDEQVYCEPDGSLWIKIFHHNNPNAYLFASTDSFTTNVYKDVNRWFRVALCNYLTDTWEFIVVQALTSGGTVSRFRWQQHVNPMVATYSEVASANITKINIGYTALSSAHGGIYNASTNPSTSGKSYILANNGASGNWFGNVGGWTAYQNGIPGFNNTVVTTGYIDLYLRVDNISELNRVLIGKDFIASDNFIEI